MLLRLKSQTNPPEFLQEAVLQVSSHHVKGGGLGGWGVWNRYKHSSRGLNTFPNKELRPNTYGLGEKAPPASTHPEIPGQSAPHTGSPTQRSTKLRSVRQI